LACMSMAGLDWAAPVIFFFVCASFLYGLLCSVVCCALCTEGVKAPLGLVCLARDVDRRGFGVDGEAMCPPRVWRRR
jgi:hypothetical protein